MARLTTIKPKLQTLRPKLQAPKDEAGRSRYRDQAAPWRAWYKTARWGKLRWQVLTDAQFTCAMCGRIEGNTSQLVADHITPHRGNEALFWSRANLQCLCANPCHNSKKQSEERRGIA